MGLTAALLSLGALGSATARADQGSASAGYTWGSPGSVSGAQSPQLTHDTPTEVTGIPNPVVQVVASNSDYYALDDTGAVWAWGAAKSGEIGDGVTGGKAFVTTPTRVEFPAGVTIASLPNPMPFDTAMAIDTNGNVWGWGYNSSSQLCVKSKKVATPVMLPLSDTTLASGAGDHALYLSNGTLYACGGNDAGDLGIGRESPYTGVRPMPVIDLPSEDVTAVTTSFHNSGALMSDGTYYDWGLNSAGQLGNGTTQSSTTPTQVPLAGPATQVSVGGSVASNGQTIALLSDGSVWMWGSNAYGQLGNGSTAEALSPAAVDVPSGVTFDFVASGGASAYAIDTDGNGWAWGQDNKGQLGIGSTNTDANPLPLSIGVTFTQISATAANVYAR